MKARQLSSLLRFRQPLVGNPVTLVAEADRLDIVEIPIEVPAVRHDPFLEGCFGDPLGDAVGPLKRG